jgi:hypothetical protein
MRIISIVGLFVAGVIHLLPIPGVMGASQLTLLYGIEVSDPNVAILLQHRALLFGVLGGLMLSGIVLPRLRIPALVVGLCSAASFIGVALAVRGYNASIHRVMTADVLATILLAAGLAAEVRLLARRGH